MQDLFDTVRDASVGAGGFNPFVALVLLALVVALAAFVLSRLRANPAGGAPAGAVFTAQRMSAADHRALAERALARGDWDTTVVESMRALAAGLFERGLVVEETGATAHEISATAAQSFPAARDRLDLAAASFDETRYGGRPAGGTRRPRDPRPRGTAAIDPRAPRSRRAVRWRRCPDEGRT